MSSSRMCWSMCITISCSPSTSIGETSAARIASQAHAEQQQPPDAGRVRLPGLPGAPPGPHVQERQRQDQQ